MLANLQAGLDLIARMPPRDQYGYVDCQQIADGRYVAIRAFAGGARLGFLCDPRHCLSRSWWYPDWQAALDAKRGWDPLSRFPPAGGIPTPEPPPDNES